MNVALQRPLSAADLNFNPALLPLDRLVDLAREHWGITGDFTPLEGERDQNLRVTAADGASYVLKVSAAGESEGAVDFQVAALRHLERNAPDLPVPRVIASRSGNDREWTAAADGTRHMVRLLSWLPGTPVSQCGPLTVQCASERRDLPGAPGARAARTFSSARPAFRRLGHPARAVAGPRRAGLGRGGREGALRGLPFAPEARRAPAAARLARAGRARRRARRQPAARGTRTPTRSSA